MSATTDAIKVGDRVYLKPRIATLPGIEGRRIGGGEAVVIAIDQEPQGPVYRVQRTRTERIRVARAEDLIVHRKGSQHQDDKGARHG